MKKPLLLLTMAAILPLASLAQDCHITLPWGDDFENCTTTGGNSLPECWTRVSPFVSGTATYPNVYSFGGNQGKVLNFNGQSSSSTPGTLSVATPLIPAPLNSLEVTFKVYKSGLKAYLATNPTDPATYILIGSYSPGYNWTTYEIHTDTVTTSTAQGYIVFEGVCVNTYGQYSNAYLDDLTISSINLCDKPASVSVGLVGPTSAEVSWDAVAGVNEYAVNYSDNGSLTGSILRSATSNSITLNGLTPGTDYTVWVRSVCRPGDSSDTRSATFTTQLSCYSIVNLTQVGRGVDAASFQWELDGRGNAATQVLTVLHDVTDPSVPDVVEMSTSLTSHIFTGLDREHEYLVTFYTLCGDDTASAVSSSITFRQCGESELYSNDFDYMSDIPISTAYATSFSQVLYRGDIIYSMDTIWGVAFHRRLSATSSVINRYLTIFMGHTTQDSLTASVNTGSLTTVSQHVLYALPAQEWDTLLFSTPFIYDGHSNILLVVEDSTGVATSLSAAGQWYWHNTNSRTYYKYGTSSVTYAYKQPDARFVGLCNDDMACDPPAVVMGDVDSANAVVNWFADNDVSYIIEYHTLGSTDWIAVDTVVNENSFTLENLNPSTYYEVRVGVVCDSTVRYSTPVSFSTTCALFHLPFNFTQTDMIAAADNRFSDCWNWSSHIYKGRLTESHRGYVRNAGNGEWFMLPAIAEPLNGARLRTWVASSDEGSFKVGIASLENCSDVVWIDTVEVPAGNPNTSHDEYISYLDNYTGTGNRVVVSPIVNNNFHFIYFFDFHVEPIDECRPVANLTYDTSDAGSITFHWTPMGTATQWVVYVNGVETATVNGTPHYTATALEPFTGYDISVRPLCAVGDTGEAVTERFYTGCNGEECWLYITGHSSTGDGWRGGRLQVWADGTLLTTFTLSNGSIKTQSLRICANMHVELKWHSGNDDEVCSFEVFNSNGDTLFTTPHASWVLSDVYETDHVCGDHTPEPPVGIGEVDLQHRLQIYPNPAHNTVLIQGIPTTATITLVDLNGREVLSLQHATSVAKINVAGLHKGIYFLQVITSDEMATQRLVVQ